MAAAEYHDLLSREACLPISCFTCGQVNPDNAVSCQACGQIIGALRPDPPDPTECSTLFGRQRELATLSQTLDQAIAGHGRLVMLAGEAGIGKSRLARELARIAREKGATVFWGCSFEGDWQPPYGPWVEALGEYARACPPQRLRHELGLGASPIAQLVSAVRVALPDLPPASPLHPDEERIRLYDAVIQFLLAVAESHPVVLVLDDLHWADPDSLRLLRHVARFVDRTSLLVVGAYRDPEPGLTRGQPLAEVLAVLRREVDYFHLGLTGLNDPDVADYLAHLAGQALPPKLIRVVYAETDGNPFFVRELFRYVVEERKILRRADFWSTDLSPGELGIPIGVRQIVDQRVSRLSGPTNALLRIAAGLTGGFSFAVIRALTALSDDVLLDGLDEALSAGLLRVAGDSPPTYDFAHAIVRHALDDGLNPDRRARLHRSIAIALEQLYGDHALDHAAELASQYNASATLPGAAAGIPYALAAARLAREGCALERSVAFYRVACHLAASCDAAVRADALEKLVIAEAEALLLENAARAVESVRAAQIEAGVGPAKQAAFLTQVVRVLKEGGASSKIWAPLVDRGLALVGDVRNLPWARLTLLEDRFEPIARGPVSCVRWLGHDPRAVGLARASGDEADYALTLEIVERRTRVETEGIHALARTWTQPSAVMRALAVTAGDFVVRHAAFREAVAVGQELLDASERYGSLIGQAEALTQLATAWTALGELVRARHAARQMHDVVARLGPGHRLHFVELGLDSMLAYYLEGDWQTLAALADRLARHPEMSRSPVGLIAVGVASYNHHRAGNPVASRRWLAALTPVISNAEPTLYSQSAAVGHAALTVWELGLAEYAATYRRLALDLIAGGGDSFPLCASELVVARMSTLLGDAVGARDYFDRARATLERSGCRPLRAIVDYDEAVALTRVGAADRARIASLLADARTAFHVLHMDSWVKRVAALEEKRGEPRRYPDSLTAREVEVLLLIADGKASKQIATELVVSVSTVDRHIANIYRKINARSRAEATAYALRHLVTKTAS